MSKAKTILLLGHSLVEFYDWQGRFPGHRVYSLGRAGETVRGLLSRLKDITEKYPPPDFIFIMTGINDIAMENYGFMGDYYEILKTLKSSCPGARIVVNFVPPVSLEWVPDDSVRKINSEIKEMTEKMDAEYLDLYGIFIKEGAESCLLQDGVHLNERGYSLWTAAIEEIIGYNIARPD